MTQPITYYQRARDNEQYQVEVTGLGFPCTDYPGAFSPTVNRILLEAVGNSQSVLHLFSGSSLIGHERVDLSMSQATSRKDVLDFIASDTRSWDFVVLDPPYEIYRKSKLRTYSKTASVSSDVVFRRRLCYYFRERVKNILWLDICAPLPAGFTRKKLWFLLPGGYHTVRVLTWLLNKKYTGVFTNATDHLLPTT